MESGIGEGNRKTRIPPRCIRRLAIAMMNPPKHELEQAFATLSDEELLARCESGTLTDEARSIALKEAHRRGLNPVKPQLVVEKESPYYGDFVIVARNLNMAEAHLYKMLLEAAGIPAEVGDANFSRAYGSMYSAYVKVPEAFLAEARGIFAAYNRGELALDKDFKADGA